jgi:hypothetical protein
MPVFKQNITDGIQVVRQLKLPVVPDGAHVVENEAALQGVPIEAYTH